MLFALQQMHGARPLDFGQKPHRMRAQQPLDGAQIARRTGRIAGVLAERFVGGQHVDAAARRCGRLFCVRVCVCGFIFINRNNIIASVSHRLRITHTHTRERVWHKCNYYTTYRNPIRLRTLVIGLLRQQQSSVIVQHRMSPGAPFLGAPPFRRRESCKHTNTKSTLV